MTPAEEERILTTLADVYAKEIEPRFAPNLRLCVLAARIADGVLDYFGVPHHVQPVEAFVMNDAAADLFRRDVPIAEWPDEAWSIGSTANAEGSGYPGHLLIVTGRGYRLDLSARQYDRPAPGRIAVDGPRLWWPDQITNNERGDWLVKEADAGTLWWWAPFADTSYRRTPDWRMGKVEAGWVIRVMREIFEKSGPGVE